jgi:hypothetical protein
VTAEAIGIPALNELLIESGENCDHSFTSWIASFLNMLCFAISIISSSLRQKDKLPLTAVKPARNAALGNRKNSGFPQAWVTIFPPILG